MLTLIPCPSTSSFQFSSQFRRRAFWHNKRLKLIWFHTDDVSSSLVFISTALVSCRLDYRKSLLISINFKHLSTRSRLRCIRSLGTVNALSLCPCIFLLTYLLTYLLASQRINLLLYNVAYSYLLTYLFIYLGTCLFIIYTIILK